MRYRHVLWHSHSIIHTAVHQVGSHIATNNDYICYNRASSQSLSPCDRDIWVVLAPHDFTQHNVVLVYIYTSIIILYIYTHTYCPLHERWGSNAHTAGTLLPLIVDQWFSYLRWTLAQFGRNEQPKPPQLFWKNTHNGLTQLNTNQPSKTF